MDADVVPSLEKLLSTKVKQNADAIQDKLQSWLIFGLQILKNGTTRDSTIMEPVTTLFQTLSNVTIIFSMVSSYSASFCSHSFSFWYIATEFLSCLKLWSNLWTSTFSISEFTLEGLSYQSLFAPPQSPTAFELKSLQPWFTLCCCSGCPSTKASLSLGV